MPENSLYIYQGVCSPVGGIITVEGIFVHGPEEQLKIAWEKFYLAAWNMACYEIMIDEAIAELKEINRLLDKKEESHVNRAPR